MTGQATAKTTIAPKIELINQAKASSKAEFEVRAYSEFIAKYGVLRSDHPISQFVEQRVKQLHPDSQADEMPRVVVLGSKGAGINAFAFSNGILALTPELIEFINHKEELDAVILHESRHILGKHIKKINASNSLGEVIGEMRLHEYESDTSAFVRQGDPRCDSNPRGSLVFFERLRGWSKAKAHNGSKESWDLAHGRLTDRIAILRSVMQQFELGSAGNPLNDQLQRPLRPIPKEFQRSLKQIPESRSSALSYKFYPGDPQFDSWRKKLFKIVQESRSLPQLELAIKSLQKIHEGVLGQIGSNDSYKHLPSNQLLLRELKSVRELAYKMWVDKVDVVVSDGRHLSKRHRDLSIIAVAADRLGLNLLDPGHKNSIIGAELKACILSPDRNQITLSKTDFPVLLDILGSNQFQAESQRCKIAQIFTDLLLSHGVFDKTKSSGIAPKRLCLWLENCVNILNQRQLDQGSMTSEAELIPGFVKKSLKQAFELNSEFDGDTPEALEGWITGITKLAGADSKIVASIVSCVSSKSKFSYQVISQALGDADINTKLAELASLFKLFTESLQSNSDFKSARQIAGKIVAGVAELPEICLPKNADNLDIFRDLFEDAATHRKHSMSLFKQTRQGCASILLDQLDPLLNKQANVELISELFVALCQAGSRSQSDYDDLVLFGIDSSETSQNTHRIVQKIISRLGEPSALLPEAHFSFVSSLKESASIRESTTFYGLVGLEERLAHQPTLEYYRECIGEFLATWNSPLVLAAEHGADYAQAQSNIFEVGLSFFDKKPESKEDLQLLHDIGYFAPSVSIRKQMQGVLLPEILGKIDPVESLKFIFDRLPRQLNYGLKIETLSSIDAALRKPSDFTLVEGRLVDFWNSTTEIASKTASLVAADALSYALKNLDKSQLLKAIISSVNGDDQLKSMLLQAWLMLDRYSISDLMQGIIEANNKEDLKEAIDKFKRVDRLSNRKNKSHDPDLQPETSFEMYTPNMWLQQLYALGPFERMGILRDTLNGPGGLLSKKNGRDEIIEMIFGEVLAGDKDNPLNIKIREVTAAFMRSASNDELTELLVATLCDRVLSPPTKERSWKPSIQNFIEENSGLWIETSPGKLMDINGTVAEISAVSAYKMVVSNKISPIIQELLEGKQADNALLMSHKLKDLGLITAENSTEQQISALDFISEVGSRLDAPGVRALQLIGQLMSDIDPSVRDRFLSLYDARSGQTAISAWQTLGKVSSEFRSAIETLGPKLGGGSIYTVFLGDVSETGQEAIRVMNPNALAHVEERLALLRRTVEDLISVDSSYKQLLPILNLVEEWIRSEMKDKDFSKDDLQFRADWNNWAPDWALQKGLSVRIPESKSIPSLEDQTVLKVVRDEYIEGVTNFTKAETLDPQTRKDMAALGVQFYLAQIIGKNPFMESSVLSDISKGNAGVTQDLKQLAVFDRGMYLKLSLAEKLQLKTIIEADSTEQIVNAIIGLLKSFPENKKRSAAKLAQEINKFIRDRENTADPEALVFNGISHLFSKGVHLPLKWSLLLKNINAWKQIVTEAGFANLQAALNYS